MKETLQELFDKVVRHFAIQIVPAANAGTYGDVGGCRYRMRVSELPSVFKPFLPLHLRNPNDTLECAAGSLIPDSEYNQAFENKSICGLMGDGKVTVPRVGIDLVQALQNVHDNAASAKQTLTSIGTGEELRKVAERFELDASRVTW